MGEPVASANAPADGAALRKLVEAVRDHAHFGHPTAALEIVETHISVILLTGPCAYKFKKPLDLGFLNFSTLADRKYYCEQELLLNRRLAPGHYLEVVPVTGSREHPAIAGGGPVLEYAVRMVQFPREMEFDRLAARGELTSALIDQLADRVEQFHRHAAMARPGSPYGSIESIRDPALANFTQLAANLESRDGERECLRGLEEWTRAQCSALLPQFQLRRDQGRIRECHGDMHLGNMVLHDGELVIFDCIEFSEELRWIDVMNEVAFVVMDLEARGSRELAWRFLNAYLERGGDYGGVAVLRFYLAYRALVRAKISSIRLQEPALAPTARAAETASWQAHLRLADSYAVRQTPALIITHGLSGSGKTRVTQELLQILGAVRVRSDIERKRLHGLPAQAKTGSETAGGIYSPAASQITYARLAQLAALLLEAGHRVIVDAAFLRREQREALQCTARERRVPCVILDFRAAVATLRQRLRARIKDGGDASEADAAVLDYQMTNRETLGATELESSITVETEAPVDLQALRREIMSRLKQRR